jgi:hypothetical protein
MSWLTISNGWIFNNEFRFIGWFDQWRLSRMTSLFFAYVVIGLVSWPVLFSEHWVLFSNITDIL